MATTDDKKIIFSMVGVSKVIQQNQKQVLKNIYLSFFYGAKIGIVGMNGAKVASGALHDGRATVSLESVKSGIYMVKVEGLGAQKVIVH